MANEGFLGKHVLKGERAATDDHPVILHHLPLSEDALGAVIPVETVMKRVDVTETSGEGESVVTKTVGAAWEPLLSTDTEAVPAGLTHQNVQLIEIIGLLAIGFLKITKSLFCYST